MKIVSEFIEKKLYFYLKEVKDFPRDFYVFYRYEVPQAFVRGVRRCFNERLD